MFWHRLSEFWLTTFRSPRRPPAGWLRLAFDVVDRAQRLGSQSETELRQAAMSLRYRVLAGESLNAVLPEAFALVVETSSRQLGMRHFPVQILGGIALHHGCIAEIQTGEGKTLLATLPLFLNALSGMPVHLATANDYLAKRDADLLRPVFESLGMSVGAITGDLSPSQRRAAYACDITYGTAREFGFDFLRDRLTLRASGKDVSPLFSELLRSGGQSPGQSTIQRHPLHFALIDEADSLLIDEARTPLIISSQATDPSMTEALLRWSARVADEFRNVEFVVLDPESKQRELTSAGFRRLRAVSKPAEINGVPLSELAESVVRSVTVAETLQRDHHYVVRDGQIMIVDEFTGRIADGRKWRNGVHQAIEAREGVPLSPMTHHSARITVQEFFAGYDRVCGMTGTAASSAYEFWNVYGLPVMQLPTHKPARRQRWGDRVLPTSDARWEAIAADVLEMQRAGRPILIGTRTIEQSEQLSSRLTTAGLEHQVLNARNHAREAEVIADAGCPGCVTVATNMAGRGTDIRLQDDAEARGGLHVICSELHPSARIDRQLAGRCGRQGDPGSVQSFMSLDDEILASGLGLDRAARMREFGSQNAASLDQHAAAFRNAQATVERTHQQERQMLLAHTRQQTRQLTQLGLDPFLDGV